MEAAAIWSSIFQDAVNIVIIALASYCLGGGFVSGGLILS